MTARIIILTKEPLPGRVKTRLAPGLRPGGPERIHQALVDETLSRALATGLPVDVCLAGDPHGPFAARLRSAGAAVLPQACGDLGARLTAALAGPGRRLVLGTDCPLLEPAWLLAAVDDPAPVVLGPSDDGGYWMLTIDAPCPGLFRDIPWSTAAVAATTMNRARELGLHVSLAPTCYDIDEPADLQRLLADPRCSIALRDTALPLLRR